MEQQETQSDVGSTSLLGRGVNLKCWQCGKTKQIVITHLPKFAFEVAEMAKEAGWIGVIDMRHSRSIVLCSNECDKLARTQYGYRKHPRHAS